MANDFSNGKVDRQNEMFEAILKTAAEEAMLQEMASYPNKDKLKEMNLVSDDYNKRILNIIAEKENVRRRNVVKRVFLRVAAFIGIFTVVGGLGLMSVEASRNFILNSVINIRSDHVAFEFSGVEYCLFDYENLELDNNFEYLGSQEIDSLVISVYSNARGKQIVIQKHKGVNLSAFIDTDYREFVPIELNGRDMFFFESTTADKHHVIMWYENATVHQIFANISVDELFEVTERFIASSLEN